MKFLDVNGTQLAYDVKGRGEPVIFIHGFLANATGPYYSGFKRTIERQYRVFSLDVRGHGGSAPTKDNVTLEQCAHDIAAFAKAHNLKRPRLLGHSMGAYLSMAAAIAYPDKFGALALVTSAASKGQPSSDQLIAGSMAARASREKIHEMFGGMFVRRPTSETLDVVRDAALAMPEAIHQEWLRREWPNSNLTAGLSSIRQPVLSLICARDVVVSPEQQYDDALRMPQVKAVTFSDEGHMFPIEAPERCGREVLRFWQDLS